MIDHEKKIPGRKELLTAGILAAAVLIAAGTASLRSLRENGELRSAVRKPRKPELHHWKAQRM